MAGWPSFKIIFICVYISGFLITVKGSCKFPDVWKGEWFQKGVHDPIIIKDGMISTKGTCKQMDIQDKFLIESRSEGCYRCVAFHLKHNNILQYKETFCSKKQSLDLCSEINGDAQLYSMFRLNAPPVTCPFKGPFTFTYSRGQKECRYPMSLMESCTQNSSLLIKFQACADVSGSESRVEELVCHAVWKEGSTRHLVGKLEHRMAKTDEDKFRCFVFEKMENEPGYLMSQSGDATCDGLFSATEGSRTMKLTKEMLNYDRCQFPEWSTVSKKWKTLDGSLVYEMTHESIMVMNTTTGELDTRLECMKYDFDSATTVQVIVHSMQGCVSGYRCMRIHKRAHHVLEFQLGNLASQITEACQDYNMDVNILPYTTLTTFSPKPLDCPLSGVYMIQGYQTANSGTCTEISALTAGCSSGDRLDFLHQCSQAAMPPIPGFQCHGSWEENGTNYIIATAVDTKKHYCIAYVERDKLLKVSGSPEMCLRNFQPGKDGLITINGTNRGLCHDTGDAVVRISSLWVVMFSLLVLSLTSR